LGRREVIVLDTHALIWWANGDLDLLSADAAKAIGAEQRSGKIIVSSITAWEIAMLVSHGRLSLTMDVAAWLAVVEEIEAVAFAAVDNEIGVKAVELPGEFHKDPADRIIVATARKLGAPVITADEKIRGYRHVKTIW
jgi:PIN domain nuclease of toxin-antitoxin system